MFHVFTFYCVIYSVLYFVPTSTCLVIFARNYGWTVIWEERFGAYGSGVCRAFPEAKARFLAG